MTDRVRARLQRDHRDTLDAVVACADAVAASWDTPPTARTAVVDPFEACLRRSGAFDSLSCLLETAVYAVGTTLRTAPVSAPPFVAVTSVGPVLRATLDHERLVVTLRAFDVVRDPTRRYVRADTDALTLVEVERRSVSSVKDYML